MSDDNNGFEYDVFISWRSGNGLTVNDIEALSSTLKAAGIKSHYFGKTKSAVDEVQEFAIARSRAMLVLLGSAGLTRPAKGKAFDDWSYQYMELQQLRDANHNIANKAFKRSQKALDAMEPRDREAEWKWREGQLIPCFTVCLWYDDRGAKIGSVEDFVTKFLPDEDDHLRRIASNSGHVRWLLLDEDRLCPRQDMTQYVNNKTDDSKRSAEWKTETIDHIKTWFAEHRIPLIGTSGEIHEIASAGNGGGGGGGQSASAFNAKAYIKTAQARWTQPRQQELNTDISIPIAFTRAEATDQQVDQADAVSFIANGRGAVWVAGEAGAGKSTALRKSALRDADNFLREQSEARCPFFAPLAQLCDIAFPDANLDAPVTRDLAEIIARYLNKPTNLGITGNALRTFLSTQPCTLYIDAVDGVLDDPLRSEMSTIIREDSAAWSDVRFVFSCRPNQRPDDFFDTSITTIELAPLTAPQIETFVEAYASKHKQGSGRGFKQRFMALQSKLDAKRERAATSSIQTPLVVAIVCYLLLEDDSAFAGDSASAEARIMDALFNKIIETSDKRQPPFDVVGVMASLARKTLLSTGSMKFSYPPKEVRAKLNANGDLDDLTPAARKRELEAREDILLNSVIMRGNKDAFEFVHDRFAEHLVASSIASSCNSAADVATNLERLLPALKIDDSAPSASPAGFESGERRRFELIGLVCSHIQHQRAGDRPSAALLAEICAATVARINHGDFEYDHGSAQAALAFTSAITGLGLLTKDDRDRAKAKAIEDAMLTCYLRHRSKWRISERDMIVAAMATCEVEGLDVTLWSRVATADDGRATDWVSVPKHALAAARTAVLVTDYKEFVMAKDRYDDEYWPHRNQGEREFAEKVLIPFANGARSVKRPENTTGGIDTRLVVGDLDDFQHNVRGLWSDQLRYTARPVVNITRTEAAAYALWRSAREGGNISLPSEEDWVAIISGFDLRSQIYPWGHAPVDGNGSPGGNIAQSDLEGPSTTGVFSPLALSGLIDFGSNVYSWLASSHRGDSDRFIGAHYNSSDQEAQINKINTHYRHYGTRREYVGFWLIKR